MIKKFSVNQFMYVRTANSLPGIYLSLGKQEWFAWPIFA